MITGTLEIRGDQARLLRRFAHDCADNEMYEITNLVPDLPAPHVVREMTERYSAYREYLRIQHEADTGTTEVTDAALDELILQIGAYAEEIGGKVAQLAAMTFSEREHLDIDLMVSDAGTIYDLLDSINRARRNVCRAGVA